MNDKIIYIVLCHSVDSVLIDGVFDEEKLAYSRAVELEKSEELASKKYVWRVLPFVMNKKDGFIGS